MRTFRTGMMILSGDQIKQRPRTHEIHAFANCAALRLEVFRCTKRIDAGLVQALNGRTRSVAPVARMRWL